MSKIKIGNITSSTFAIGNSNTVISNSIRKMNLNQSDIDAIKEELLYVKSQLREGSETSNAIDTIRATDQGKEALVNTLKKHMSVFTSSPVVNLISSGVLY